jgi:hypothetical protein
MRFRAVRAGLGARVATAVVVAQAVAAAKATRLAAAGCRATKAQEARTETRELRA